MQKFAASIFSFKKERQHAQKQIICIDGNIGAGKSTVLNEIKKKYPVYVEDIAGWGFLDEFYRDPSRWSFILQTSILLRMRKQYEEMMNIPSSVVFVERAPASSLVFAEIARNNNHLTEKEYKLLFELFDVLKWEPAQTFFLNTPVNVAFERVKQRGRECEVTVEKQYLQDLHNLYIERMRPCTTSIEGLLSPENIAKEIYSYI